MSATDTLLVVSHGSDYDGGAEFVFREFVEVTHDHYKVIAVLPAAGRISADVERTGVDIRVVPVPRWAHFRSPAPPSRWRSWVSLARGLVYAIRCVRAERPAVIVTNTMVVPTFAVAARLLRVPHVWMVQEFGQRDHRLRFLLGHRFTTRLIESLSSQIVCCSDAVAQMFPRALAKGKVTTVYYAVDLHPSHRPPRREPRSKLRAILVGRVTESKGQADAVAALGVALEGGADIDLSLVGPCTAEAREWIQRIAGAHGVTGRVMILDLTDEVMSELGHAHVALMCSSDEAFGRVTVEAMKAGLPVCGTDSGGTREIIEHHRTGLLYSPGDVASLGAHLYELWANEELRAGVAAAAERSSSERFTKCNYQRGITDALLAAIDNGVGARTR